MRVEKRGFTLLKLRIRPLRPWVIGALLMATGIALAVGTYLFMEDTFIPNGDKIKQEADLTSLLSGLGSVFSNLGYLFSAVLIIIGLSVAGFSKIAICTFDKSSGLVIIEWKSLLRIVTIKHSLSEVILVRVEEKKQFSARGFTLLFYRVTLLLDSGSCQPLTPHWSTSPLKEQETADTIREFLLA